MIKTIPIAAVLALTTAMPGLAGEHLTAFDVAEDHTAFVFAPAPVFEEDGFPAHGNPFVTQGYIYPAGTLADGVEGVLADGSPAFPDDVLGIWTCDGWFVGEAMHATSGTWLISRQVFEFTTGDLLITQGPEMADQMLTYERPITGGTGDYVGATGVMEQTLLGFTSFMGVSVTFEIPEATSEATFDAASENNDWLTPTDASLAVTK